MGLELPPMMFDFSDLRSIHLSLPSVPNRDMIYGANVVIVSFDNLARRR